MSLRQRRALTLAALTFATVAAGYAGRNSLTGQQHPTHAQAPVILRDAEGGRPLVRKARSTNQHTRHPRQHTTAVSRASYLVLIVLDGARPDYFNSPGIPHLRAPIHSGTWHNNAVPGIPEPETPAGQPS